MILLWIRWNQAHCQCIMSKESGGNANAVNQNGAGGSYDVGLWQVNSMNWASCNGTQKMNIILLNISRKNILNFCISIGGKAPCDPTQNLNCGDLMHMCSRIRAHIYIYIYYILSVFCSQIANYFVFIQLFLIHTNSKNGIWLGRKYMEVLVHLQCLRMLQQLLTCAWLFAIKSNLRKSSDKNWINKPNNRKIFIFHEQSNGFSLFFRKKWHTR